MPQPIGVRAPDTLQASIALADVAEDGPTWIQILAAGDYRRRDGRKVELTAADLVTIADNFATAMGEGRWPKGAPLNVEHVALSGTTPDELKSMGFLVDVEARDDGATLWGLCEWTEEGRRRVRAGEYQGFSAELYRGISYKRRDGKHPGWFLGGGAITNNPVVSGMQPLAASEDAVPNDNDPSRVERLETLLSEERATLADVQREREELAEKVETLDRTVTALTEERDQIKAQLAERVEADRAALADKAVDEGRIGNTDAERAEFLAFADQFGLERAEAVFAPERSHPAKRKGHDGADDSATPDNLIRALSEKGADFSEIERAWRQAGGKL